MRPKGNLMTKRSLCSLIVVLLLLFLFAAPSIPADRPDFSGSYTLTDSKGAIKLTKGASRKVRIVQSKSTIAITRVMDGRESTNRFRLDGSEGVYNTAAGQKGTGTATFKDKSLIVDTFVTTRTQPKAPDVKIHTREQWELSPDLKTLTVRSDVVFAGTPVKGSRAMQPWSEIYTRD